MSVEDDLASFASGLVDSGSGAMDYSYDIAPTPMLPPAWMGAQDAGGGGAPSGFAKFAQGLVDEFTGKPLESFSKALGLGVTGMNIGNQFKIGSQINTANKNVEQAQKQAQAAAAPAVAFGTETLDAAKAGKLPAPMQAAVAQWVDQAKGAMRAKYAQMGLGTSSDLASEEAKIDQMAQAMVAQLLQQQEATALSGLQTGVSAATGGGQLAAQQQQMLTNLLASANQQLGRLGGSAA